MSIDNLLTSLKQRYGADDVWVNDIEELQRGLAKAKQQTTMDTQRFKEMTDAGIAKDIQLAKLKLKLTDALSEISELNIKLGECFGQPAPEPQNKSMYTCLLCDAPLTLIRINADGGAELEPHACPTPPKLDELCHWRLIKAHVGAERYLTECGEDKWWRTAFSPEATICSCNKQVTLKPKL